MYYLNQPSEIKNLIDEFAEAKILWLDTEVADYHSNQPRISLIQILAYPQDTTGARTCILDVLEQPSVVDYFIQVIMSDRSIEKVFHNAKYDLQFLGKTKAKNVICTLNMAQKIPYYMLPLSHRDLKSLTEHLTPFNHVSKENQGSDWSIRPLSERQLEYAKMEVVYLAQVYQALAELTNKCEHDPYEEDVVELSRRYREIEEQWKLLHSEIEHLKERAKEAMRVQNVKETHTFKLFNYERKNIKVNFNDLAEIVIKHKLPLDYPLTLTKKVKEQLEFILPQIKHQEEVKHIWTLNTKIADDE